MEGTSCSIHVQYPVALRAISATVPTAFFVLACQSLQENEPTKRQKLPKTGIKNWAKIVQNRRPEGSWRLLGEVLGPLWVPGVPQRGPKDVRIRKSYEKFVQTPFVPHFFGPPKSHIFCIFSIFAVFFWDTFSEAVLEGLRAPFLKDFGVMFELFFRVFVKILGGARF